MMKKIQLIVLAICAFAFSAKAQDLPQPSPSASVTQRIGLTDVTVEYSRPGVKDRKIFGGLLPYGKVWRTGANSTTQLITSTPVTIDGQTLPAGTYSIFTVPGENEWKFMINKNAKASEGDYSSKEDLVSMSVKAEELKESVETMTFLFEDVKTGTANLVLSWANRSICIPIEVEYDKMAMKNIEEALSKDDVGFYSYNSAASYYMNNGKDMDKALEWAKKSVSMKEAFYNVYNLSLVQAARGEYKDAIKTAEKSMKLAVAADSKPYVDMNKANIEKWKKKK